VAALLWVMAAPGESAPVTWETYLAPLLTGALVAWVAAGVGEWLLARLRVSRLPRGQRVAYAIALGFGAVSLAVMGLALCHGLSPGAITIVLMAAGVLLPPQGTLSHLRGGLRDAVRRQHGSPGVAIAFSVLMLMLVSYLAIGLCPPFDTDSLRYHLRLPELYLQAHTFVYPERNHFAQFPLGAEMLYAIGLAFGGPSGANLIVVVAGMACLLGIYSLTAERFSPAAGVAAAVIFGTTPLVGCLFGATVTDLFVCLYVVLGVGAVWRHRNGTAVAGAMNGAPTPIGRDESRPYMGGPEESSPPGGPTYGLLVLAGLCGGLATATKLGGGYAVGLMAVWAAWPSGTRVPRVGGEEEGHPRDADATRGPKPLRRFLAVAVAAALVVAPWIVKTWVVTGDPVFPLLTQMFGTKGWRPEYTAAYSAEVRSYGHVGGSVLDYLLSPLWLTLDWKTYGTPAPLGPVWVALLVALALLGRRGRPVWGLTAWCAGFFALWLLTAQVARFVLPGLAVLSIIAGFVAVELGRGLSAGRPAIPMPLSLIMVAMASWTCYWQWTAYEPYLYLTGQETRDEYVSLHADYYPVVKYANQKLPPGSRILFVGATLSYGLQVPALVETGFAGVTAVALANETRSPAELAHAIAARGFTHILYDLQAPDQAWARKMRYFAWRDDAARQRFERMLIDEADAVYYYEGVCLYRLTEGTGNRRRGTGDRLGSLSYATGPRGRA